MNINNTIQFIQKAHKNQTDKAGNPYYLHPISVMNRLPDDASENEKLAALLHDVIADTEYTAQNLLDMGYNQEVIDMVKLLTRDRSSSLTYMEWIRAIAASGNIGAIRIKLADNEDNSDPDRIAQLPPENRGIVNRYRRSMKILRQALEEYRGSET